MAGEKVVEKAGEMVVEKTIANERGGGRKVFNLHSLFPAGRKDSLGMETLRDKTGNKEN